MSTRSQPQTDAGFEGLLNRELSWLDLNERVLDLAADEDEPLLERVKFCGIFSTNLDEFFMVRVAGLLDQIAAGVAVRSPDGRPPQATLAEIRERVLELTGVQSKLWRSELCPALAREGIEIGTVESANEAERTELESLFGQQIYPVLTPLAVGPGQPFPYISGLTSSLGLAVRDPESGEERFARVKVPEKLPRFVTVGTRGLRIPLETVIASYLGWLFPGMEVVERAAFRVTRDGDTEISDDADDLLEAVESELRRRRFGAVVRLEVSSSMSRDMLAGLTARLAVRDDAVYPVHGSLDLGAVSQLYGLDRPDLKYQPWVPHTQRRLAVPKGGDLFAEIDVADVAVQHPYDSFATSVEAFVRAAADDPDVAALKTTIYRTSRDSALGPALIEAAEQGKQTVCIVELKARFDEQRNIQWARDLEQAGVHVAYGFPDLKIHAKTTLVVRRDGDRLRRYAHIGTGNYHATTARIYEDVGLFTADPDITAEIADLFNFVTGFARPQEFRKLLVAPFNLRRELVERIRTVAAAAEAGETARIRIKVNNLTDPAIIDELCRASQSGAEVDLVVRAVCMLRPGVEGQSDRVRVRSVLGRFLEHSRLFCFEAGEAKSYLLGSADLMERNLDHRIEVLVPVEASHVRSEIDVIFKSLLRDNAQAWELRSDGRWKRLQPHGSESRRTAQDAAMQRRARLRHASQR